MQSLRRLLLPLVAAAGLAAAFSPSAFAATPPSCTPTQPQSLSSTHFTVTYNDDTGAPEAVTSAEAGDLLAAAERAYAAYAAQGFPAPLTSGGKTNFHILDLSSFKVSSIICPGDIDFDVATLRSDRDYSASFDVFAEIEDRFGGFGGWLNQGAASWAAWSSLGYPAASTADLGPWEMSLDCDSAASPYANCSTDGYANLGQSRWPFYEYLAERFGTTFILEALADAQSAGSNLTGLQDALVAHGSTLGAEYGSFTTKLLAGGWTAAPLNLALPPLAGTPILTGAITGNTTPQTFAVDHLATRFIQIDRGDGSADHRCYSATLTINVTLPSGVTSQPVFYWAQANNAPVKLTVGGTSATASVPWDTCTWGAHGYLSLPNTSTSPDGAVFTVSTHIDVSTTEVTATPPSTPANTYGPSTDVGSVDVAPTVSVFGPLVLDLPATATQLLLVVEANAQGSLHGALGSLDLGSASINPGENVVKYALPAGVLQTLRASAAVSNILTLSPTSQDGRVTGAPVTIKVSVEPAQKARAAKPKAKQKAKAKAKRHAK